MAKSDRPEPIEMPDSFELGDELTAKIVASHKPPIMRSIEKSVAKASSPESATIESDAAAVAAVATRYWGDDAKRLLQAAIKCLIIIGLFASCASLPVAYAPDRPEAEQIAAKSTVRILVGQVDYETAAWEFRPICHGVAIGPRLIVTAAHCVDSCVERDGEQVCDSEPRSFAAANYLQWHYHTDAQTAVISIDVDPDRDIALLTLAEPTRFYTVPAPIGAEAAFGVWRDQIHRGDRRYSDGVGLDVMSMSAQPGDSGAGLFDQRGRWVGALSRGNEGVALFHRR